MPPKRRLIAWTFAALLVLAQPSRTGLPSRWSLPTFVNVTRQAGIAFTHSFGDEKLSSILESTGAGCAFLDYDGDGDLDIYAVNGACLPGISDPNSTGHSPQNGLFSHLFRNSGDGTFTDVTQKAGVGATGYGVGVVVGDYDNDGYTDIYIANYGPNVLYHNNGDGTFTDVTQKAGVAGPQELNGFPKWSVHAAFLDYDKDGYLDLYVANYLAFDPAYRFYFAADAFPGPLDYRGQPDLLYHNNGDGTFTDVTVKAGVYNPEGRAMSVTCGDFDNDGQTDIFVSNDAMENYLYRNRGDGTFTNVALQKGVAFGEFGEATSAMGPEFGDFDNDGNLDLFVPDIGYSCLYRNNGATFDEVTVAADIAQVCGQYTSWGPLVFDYDNDGYQDIFITNGDAHADPGAEIPPIYENWESFTTEDGLRDDHVYWVKADTVHHAVWAGTDNGLACYRDGKWKVYTPEDGLAHQAVMGIDVDPKTGDVWVATFGGLSQLSGGRFQTFTQSNSGLANDVVYGVAVQGDTIWAATTAGGSRFIKETGRWDIYTSQNAPMDENWCYNVSIGKEKVFFAVWGGGILEYDLNTEKWQAYHDPDGEFEIELFPDDGLVHNITTGASSADGLLWASTYFGLSVYNFRRWRSYFENDSGLASDFVNVVRAQPGTRSGWACTDKGLSMLNYDTDLWVTYRPEDIRIHRGKQLLETRACRGIAHPFVYGVDWQGEDTVWVATAHGISRGTKKLKN